MFCTQCGKELPEGSKFCAQCGAPLSPDPAPAKKRSGGKVAVIVLVIVLALALIAFVAVLGFRFFIGMFTPVQEDTAYSVSADETVIPQETEIPVSTQPEQTTVPAPIGNPYWQVWSDRSTCFMPYSDSRYLSPGELEGLSKDALCLARNEIFARHGYIFSDEDLAEYFPAMSWYRPTIAGADFSSEVLNEYELGNIELIQLYESRFEGVSFSSGNPYQYYFYSGDQYILPDSSSRELSENDLWGMSLEELCLARNEIFARHGYVFNDQDLQEYFMQCAWYRPATPPGRTDLLSLSYTENLNVGIISDYEAKLKSKPDLSGLDTSLNVRIDTGYYSLYIPAYWEDYCIYQAAGGEDGGHSLVFYERPSHEEQGGGGLLFNICLLPTSDDYSYLPQYRELGSITDNAGNGWNVIIYYPSDVQFSMTNLDLYQKMMAEEAAILDTLTWSEGFTFSPTPLPFTQ